MKNMSKAIIVVGLAVVSVTAFILTDGTTGQGWGFLAVLVLLSGG